MTQQIAVHTTVFPGCAGALREAIEHLPTGRESPFAALQGTHFARLVVAERVRDRTVLVCSAVTDLAEAEYLVALVSHTGDLPERLWSFCAGWPGQADVRRAAAYLHAHLVRPTLRFATYEAPLARVLEGLALRRRLVEFAPRAQDLDPAALQSAFRQEFTR